jgi:micrococcal nuclease
MPSPRNSSIRASTLRIALLVSCAAWLAACGATPTAQSQLPTNSTIFTSPLPGGDDVTVQRVVDGDTIKTSNGTSVRLIGIDTPETVKPNTPVQCYGPEASAATKSILHRGTRVRLVYDAERTDRYGRTLAYVFRTSDGLFVNASLMRGGYARTLTIRPNTAYAAEFAALQAQAKREKSGLWGSC